MDYKQLVLGSSYARIRAPRSQESSRYAKMVLKIQKSYVDSMKHRRKKIQEPFTIPIYLHRNDVTNKNLNLRKLSKILMNDALAAEDKQYEFKFFVNERYAQRKYVSPNHSEESVQILLNKVSDRPADLNRDFKYNRSGELGLYINSKINDSITPITPTDHARLIDYLSSKLSTDYELVQTQQQFYASFESTHVKILSSKNHISESFVTKWKYANSERTVDVHLDTLELADKVAYIGIYHAHPHLSDYINSKFINPTTGSEISVVKVPDELVSVDHKEQLFGIMPNHILDHRQLCTQNDLGFHEVSEYDFHSSPYLKKRYNYSFVFGVEKTTVPTIPIILSRTMIRNKSTNELIEFTKFSVTGYINLVEEVMGPVVELLLSLDADLIGKNKPDTSFNVIPSDNAWLTLMILKAMGLEKQKWVVSTPKAVDFQNRDVSKLRPDFNELYNGLPIDQVCEQYSNSKNLFDRRQFEVTPGTISVDAIRGLLLSPDAQNNVIFDDSHKITEGLKLTLLLELFNNFSIKFLKQSNLVNVGFKNIFLDDPSQSVKDWNYYAMHKMVTGLLDFFEAKRGGNFIEMQKIFVDLLIFTNNGYWDLLNSEIILASKKPHNLPDSKLYLKHLMGTVVYYMHIMAQSFYANETSYVLRKLPLLRENYDINTEFERFEVNQEVYRKNVDNLHDLNLQLQHYLKVYDTDILRDGSMIIEIVKKLKEVLLMKNKSRQKFSMYIEVKDILKFVKVKQNQINIDTVYSVFNNKNIFQNKTLKIVTEMTRNFIQPVQPTPLPNGMESFSIPDFPEIAIHIVKVDPKSKKAKNDIDLASYEEFETKNEVATPEDVTFKNATLPLELQNLLQSDNSEFDSVFNDILETESWRLSEARKKEEQDVQAQATSAQEEDAHIDK